MLQVSKTEILLTFFYINYIYNLKHLNYPSSILNRNPTYFFYKMFFIILKYLYYL